MPPRTILISQQLWQTFCENFPNAAQWLTLQLDLPNYQLPSLTPAGEPVAFNLPNGEPFYECPGAR
jgi:hypothetical protein